MAPLFKFTGTETTVFADVKNRNGSTLKAEPGDVYDLVEDPKNPLFELTSAGAQAAEDVASEDVSNEPQADGSVLTEGESLLKRAEAEAEKLIGEAEAEGEKLLDDVENAFGGGTPPAPAAA